MSLLNSPLQVGVDNVWFTSDLHFGHERIIGYTGRPYADADEMNGSIIANFNKVLDDDSVLINLGDVTMNYHYLWAMEQVAGNHVLIPGNHDAIWPSHKKHSSADVWAAYGRVFSVILNIHTDLILDGTHFLLSHLPYSSHDDPHPHDRHDRHRPTDQGLPLICGHVHGAWKVSGKQLNVGVDVWGFEPVPASKVLEWAERLGTHNETGGPIK